jgi:hypothetical protein
MEKFPAPPAPESDAKPTPDAARITASERSTEPFENAAGLASHAVAALDKNADTPRRRTVLVSNAPTLPVVRDREHH